ncbi:MAG: hypothetical protein KBG15_20505, partial [Kofleriaceae bacterium]|nr:hypothetical protein [Kofleriaceae bacterium]
PRSVGSAQGHLWITRPGFESLTIVRLSDGRMFPHVLGAEPQRVYADLQSPYLVIATSRGLVRLQCFAHTLTALGTPPAQVWALQPNGNDTMLLGMTADDKTPWRAMLATNQAVIAQAQTNAALPEPTVAVSASPVRAVWPPTPMVATSWRSQLAAVDVVSGDLTARRGVVPSQSTLVQWCLAVGCSDIAIAAIILLYAHHLRGTARVSMSEAARCLGDQDNAWHEVLGHGDLAAHGLLDISGAGLALTSAARRFFDDFQPNNLLCHGTGPRQLRPGIYWSPGGPVLATTLLQLATQLGGLAVLPQATVEAITAAHLRGLTVVVTDIEAATQVALALAPARAAIVVVTAMQPWFVATILPQP